jgi:hypothetical protein
MQFEDSQPEYKSVPVRVEFTEEELMAIESYLDIIREQARADAPPETKCYISPKSRDALVAQALRFYAQRLSILTVDSTAPAKPEWELAINAQLKAYSTHRLPVYLYEAALMFESAGAQSRAREYFELFLRSQASFVPDEHDRIVLGLINRDVSSMISTNIENRCRDTPVILAASWHVPRKVMTRRRFAESPSMLKSMTVRLAPLRTRCLDLRRIRP